MNFLAHCLLAHPGDGFVAGGILGDFVKGPIPESLPVELRAGVRLHRRIDTYSNQLPALKDSARRFPRPLRRVAPVLLDIVADHCLALSWRHRGIGELGDFTAGVYAALARYRDCVPARGAMFVQRMVETDLLARYTDRATIQRAMEHVLERLRLRPLAEHLPGVLEKSLPLLNEDFGVYYPQLDAFAGNERSAAADWARAAT